MINFVPNMEQPKGNKSTGSWLRRLGWAGFFFFLFKGILWLLIGKGLLEWIQG